MTQEDLNDEVTAINSIWQDSMKCWGSSIYDLKVPDHPGIRIRLSFPLLYPEVCPKVVEVNGIRKGQAEITNIINDVYVAGYVVVYELLDAVQRKLDSGVLTTTEGEHDLRTSAQLEGPIQAEVDPFTDWARSDDILDRKSLFTGWAAKASSIEDVDRLLDQLKRDKRIARATHNIAAWRIKTASGVVYQDSDDDGEACAGSRVLHLLTVRDLIRHTQTKWRDRWIHMKGGGPLFISAHLFRFPDHSAWKHHDRLR
jgi:hypothetical protein